MQVDFLMVGHTHEDIDSEFGTFSNKMRDKDIYIPQAMKSLFGDFHIKAFRNAGPGKDAQLSANLSKLQQCVPDWQKFLQVSTNVPDTNYC